MSTEGNKVLQEILGSSSVADLDQRLTQLMGRQKIQSILSIDNALDSMVDRILQLSALEPAQQELSVAAVLMRLAAVARGKDDRILGRMVEVFSTEPVSIESLLDGDQKSYAAQSLKYIQADWVVDYAIKEALSIDSADTARKELLHCALMRLDNLSDWLSKIAEESKAIRSIVSPDSRYRRVRRIFATIFDVATSWQGEVGESPGKALGECTERFFDRDVMKAEDEVVFDAVDRLLSILVRVIELRFSHALDAEIYQVLERGKRTLSPGFWIRFLSHSAGIIRVRTNLIEAALVLARQRLTDKEIMKFMIAAHSSKTQLSSAVNKRFSSEIDLDPEVSHWWISAGDVTQSQRSAEHKIGNNEDQQIGELLITVQSNEQVMQNVSRGVVPLLAVSDPVLAATVKNAASGFKDMAQIARRLARMRKLESTDLRGSIIEFNPIDYEMVGGVKPGIRKVKVTREGVIKDFGGKKKYLVKPWVEPSD